MSIPTYDLVLDSAERSDKCIDFTTISVFWFFITVIASIFINIILLDGKVNLVGTFGKPN